MAGYCDFSKSNNAIDAEDEGKFPASIAARRLGVPIEVVRAHGSCEWHHSSKFFNRVDYYDIDDIRDWLTEPEGMEALAAAKTDSRTIQSVEYVDCRVEWIDWVGPRRHIKAQPRLIEGALVVVKGKTATVHPAQGSAFQKRLSTNGFKFTPQAGVPA